MGSQLIQTFLTSCEINSLNINFMLFLSILKTINLSPISLNEMGAAWALKSDVTSYLLPGFGFSQMTGVGNNQTIAIKLDGEGTELQDKLNQFYDKIIQEFALTRGTNPL